MNHGQVRATCRLGKGREALSTPVPPFRPCQRPEGRALGGCSAIASSSPREPGDSPPSFQPACQLLPCDPRGSLGDLSLNYSTSGCREFPSFGKSAGLAVWRPALYCWPLQCDPVPCLCSHSPCEPPSLSLSFRTHLAPATFKCSTPRRGVRRPGHINHRDLHRARKAETRAEGTLALS